MVATKDGAPALDDVSTTLEAEANAAQGAAKLHGDKLGVAGSAAAAAASADAKAGDSPKPHGDKLEGPVEEAAKG